MRRNNTAYYLEFLDSPNCNYCGELDDELIFFLHAVGIHGCFSLTQSLILKLTPTIDAIPVCWYIISIPARVGLAV